MVEHRVQEEAPHFGESYQGTRKAYGLSGALLVAWELIGIEFSASPVENLNVSLKSPQAVPYVLVVLVFYFAFRHTVEWYQADSRRRALLASRIDFVVAHVIGIAALSLYIYQALQRVQVADIVAPSEFLALFSGFALGLGLFIAILEFQSLKKGIRDRVSIILASVTFICGLITGIYAVFVAPGYALSSFALSFGVALIAKRRLRGRLRRAPNPGAAPDG